LVATELQGQPEVLEVATTSTGPSYDQAVPRGLQIGAAWAWRVILIAALLWVIGWLVRELSEVVIPVAIAILLAAMLAPVTNRLQSWGLRRGLATAVTVLGGIGLIAGTLYLIGTQIAGQATQLSGNVVESFNQLVGTLRRSPIPINPDLLQIDTLTARLADFLQNSQTTIATYAGDVGTSIGRFLAGFAIAIFALFYFLYDGRGIFRFVLIFFPREVRERVDQAAQKGWRSLSSYVRATILVALVDAVGVLIVALVLRVPLAPALAALVFIGAFIPLVGAFVSGFVAVAVALVALGWVQALIMLAGIIVVMQIEGHVLQPFLLGRAVKLHPLAVLLGIAVGVVVAGIVGALLVVPLLAFTKSFIQYLHGAAEPPPPVLQLRWRPLVRRGSHLA
jgi:predicted PurR-regulated permease PerM